jgi:integrase
MTNEIAKIYPVQTTGPAALGGVVTGALDDAWALSQWLETYGSEHSVRCARKEAERLMMFLADRRGMDPFNVRAMSADDARAFIDWLKSPAPAMISVGTLQFFGRPPDRQPLLGALSPSSVRLALRYLNSWFQYLDHLDVGAGAVYRVGNPFYRRKPKASAGEQAAVGRIARTKKVFTPEQFQHCLDTIELHKVEHPQWRAQYVRARFIFWMLAYGMFRRWELAPKQDGLYLRWGDMYKGADGWEFGLTLTKGSRPRSVAIAPDLLREIQLYRSEMGFGSLIPSSMDDHPVIADVRNLNRPVGDEVVYRTVKTICHETAERIRADHPQDAAFLDRVTPHYLRHTGATRLVAAMGGRLSEAKEQLGHADISSTQIYVEPDRSALHDGVSKLKI